MAGRIMSMKSFSDNIGNRTRDLPACSAVPQPTAPPRAPNLSLDKLINVQLPAGALGTFPCKPKLFRKTVRKAVINLVK